MGYKSKMYLKLNKTNGSLEIIHDIPQLSKKQNVMGPFNSLTEIEIYLNSINYSHDKYPTVIRAKLEAIPDAVMFLCEEFVEEYYAEHGFCNGTMDFVLNFWGSNCKEHHYEVEYFLNGSSYETNYITV